MATCAVSGTILNPNGAAATSVTVYARISQPVLSGTNLIAPAVVSAETDSSGNFTLTLQQSISVVFTVQYPIVGTEPTRQFNYTGNIPATVTASFSNVITIE
jgi:hypothetical protein